MSGTRVPAAHWDARQPYGDNPGQGQGVRVRLARKWRCGAPVQWKPRPRPFRRSPSADDIPANIQRFRLGNAGADANA